MAEEGADVDPVESHRHLESIITRVGRGVRQHRHIARGGGGVKTEEEVECVRRCLPDLTVAETAEFRPCRLRDRLVQRQGRDVNGGVNENAKRIHAVASD